MLLVNVHPDRVLHRFDPVLAFGGAIDGGEPAAARTTFRPETVRAMRSSGLGALAYRLRTELAIEAWHWNPEGRWSGRGEGYWTSSDRPGKPIRESFGYRLPRRGSTFDQADDDGYSRLTDGDPATFWKSNPYLDATNPQWVLLRLPEPQAVDTLRLRWADPYALRFRVEYWDGQNLSDVDGGQEGAWRRFPRGEQAGRSGTQTVDLGTVPNVQWVRIELLASSHTPRHPHDPRDAKGFAIREIELGRSGGRGFVDAVRHRPDRLQSPTWASSTDPWHRAADRNSNLVQPGLDLVFRSGLTNGLPALLPAAALYDTPENMAALLRWLRRRRYRVGGFEVGEEPDGQICAPEDYAALYRQTAAALRAVDRKVRLGGPGFQTIESDYANWALQRLGGKGHAKLDDPPAPGASERPRPARLLQFRVVSLRRLRGRPGPSARGGSRPPACRLGAPRSSCGARDGDDGVRLLGLRRPRWCRPPGGPFESRPRRAVPRRRGKRRLPLRLPTHRALPRARRSVGRAGDVSSRRNPASDLLGGADDDPGLGRPSERVPAGKTGGGGRCILLKTDVADPLLDAFTVRRNGRTSVLLINRDSRRARLVRLALQGRIVVRGNLVQYGRAQYAWRADGAHGRPSRSLPPVRRSFLREIALPPFSATVATF